MTEMNPCKSQSCYQLWKYIIGLHINDHWYKTHYIGHDIRASVPQLPLYKHTYTSITKLLFSRIVSSMCVHTTIKYIHLLYFALYVYVCIWYKTCVIQSFNRKEDMIDLVTYKIKSNPSWPTHVLWERQWGSHYHKITVSRDLSI